MAYLAQQAYPENPLSPPIEFPIRSEEMILLRLYLQHESAMHCVDELGKIGVLMFNDLNIDMNLTTTHVDKVSSISRAPKATADAAGPIREFVSQVSRCDIIETSLKFLFSEMIRKDIKPIPVDEATLAKSGHGRYGSFAPRVRRRDRTVELPTLHTSTDVGSSGGTAMDFKKHDIEEIIQVVLDTEANLREQLEHYDALCQAQNAMLERRFVLDISESFFTDSGTPPVTSEEIQEQMFPEMIDFGDGATSSSSTGVHRLTRTEAETVAILPSVEPSQNDSMESGRLHGRNGFGVTGRSVGFACGIVASDKVALFERLLFRSLRGNCVFRCDQIPEPFEDPLTGEHVYKSVYCIFFTGSRCEEKIGKLSESVGGRRYPFPYNRDERLLLRQDLIDGISDSDRVIAATRRQLHSILLFTSENINVWATYISHEKSLYHTLNKCTFDLSKKCLIGEAWCPKFALESVHLALRVGAIRCNSEVPSFVQEIRISISRTPPSFIVTNKVTRGFQDIVDTYAIPTYREINPGIFTVITFPFLFGVMFGDVGHGAFLLIISVYFLYHESNLLKNKKNYGEIFCLIFDGRYVLFLMSLFAIYGGLIYNDCLSMSMDIFGTGWNNFFACPPNVSNVTFNHVYPLGVDPVWRLASNDITFTNSLKMKLSIIIGVCQMMLGLFIKLFNCIYFPKKTMFIWCEVIPEMLFMMSMFGYLVFIIFFKWSIDWSTSPYPPPSLLTLMIDMFLLKGVSDESFLYDGQWIVQLILLVFVMLSMPWLLLAKPLWLLKQNTGSFFGVHRQSYAQIGKELHSTNIYLDSNNDDEEISLVNERSARRNGVAVQNTRTRPSLSIDESDDVVNEHEEFEFSEILIHQIIHTIEFVLGGISNTASYLRLWALSLAHAQLSAVFWNQLIINGINLNFGVLFVAFAIWFVATVAVMLGMESMSAFLHALRLHWVEFQNKFYDGNGILFQPFSYRTMENVIDRYGPTPPPSRTTKTRK